VRYTQADCSPDSSGYVPYSTLLSESSFDAKPLSAHLTSPLTPRVFRSASSSETLCYFRDGGLIRREPDFCFRCSCWAVGWLQQLWPRTRWLRYPTIWFLLPACAGRCACSGAALVLVRAVGPSKPSSNGNRNRKKISPGFLASNPQRGCSGFVAYIHTYYATFLAGVGLGRMRGGQNQTENWVSKLNSLVFLFLFLFFSFFSRSELPTTAEKERKEERKKEKTSDLDFDFDFVRGRMEGWRDGVGGGEARERKDLRCDKQGCMHGDESRGMCIVIVGLA